MLEKLKDYIISGPYIELKNFLIQSCWFAFEASTVVILSKYFEYDIFEKISFFSLFLLLSSFDIFSTFFTKEEDNNLNDETFNYKKVFFDLKKLIIKNNNLLLDKENKLLSNYNNLQKEIKLNNFILNENLLKMNNNQIKFSIIFSKYEVLSLVKYYLTTRTITEKNQKYAVCSFTDKYGIQYNDSHFVILDPNEDHILVEEHYVENVSTATDTLNSKKVLPLSKYCILFIEGKVRLHTYHIQHVDLDIYESNQLIWLDNVSNQDITEEDTALNLIDILNN